MERLEDVECNGRSGRNICICGGSLAKRKVNRTFGSTYALTTDVEIQFNICVVKVQVQEGLVGEFPTYLSPDIRLEDSLWRMQPWSVLGKPYWSVLNSRNPRKLHNRAIVTIAFCKKLDLGSRSSTVETSTFMPWLNAFSM